MTRVACSPSAAAVLSQDDRRLLALLQARLRAPAALHRSGDLRAGDGAHLRHRLDLHRPRKPGEKARRLFRHADRPPAGGDGARREGEPSRDPQPVRPPRRHGGGDREGQRRRVHLLLSRLDLSSRRPAQGRAAQPRLSARLQGRRSEDGDAAGRAGEELSRLRLRERSGRRAGPGRVARPHDDVARRHDRPRAGRRDRGGRRRVQARLRRQLEGLFREPVRRRAPAVRAPLLDRGVAGAVRRRAFRRLGRDRDPADAPERRALQLLGIARSASGPIRTATAISATTTTIPSSSPR